MPFKYSSLRARLDANSRPYRLHDCDSAKPWTAAPCRIWTGAIGSSGYGKINIRRRNDGKLKTRSAHRVSLADFLGVPVWRMNHVAHHCDNRACIEPLHLRSTTQRQNVRECVERGRHVPGMRARADKGPGALYAL